ncbi:MAG: hypothetical protein QMB03_12995 [Spirosomataceae bacterium]
MKKIIICILMILPLIGFGQKEDNGKIYIKHPAINVVDAFTKAWVAGDTTSMGNMMTSDFKAYNAVTSTPSDKGTEKAAFLRNARVWYDQLDYFSVKTMEGSYPDALEYTKAANDKRAVTVQCWDVLKGVHKTTGVKANMIMHRSYQLTKDNKISMVVSYVNPEFVNNIGSAMSVRKNGTIYNEHTNINSLRLMMAAVQNGDWEKYYGYFDPKAMFLDSNDPTSKYYNLDKEKANDKEITALYEIKDIEQTGYPDYLEYEMGNTTGKAGVLYSWWNMHLIRKSDKKEIMVPMHYQHDVNEDGRMVRLVSYYNAALLK